MTRTWPACCVTACASTASTPRSRRRLPTDRHGRRPATTTSSFSMSGSPAGPASTCARRSGVATPVLMLTALDAVDDRVRGLTAGADDYLTKPFAFRELAARLQALARRRALAITPAILRVADLEMDVGSRVVRRAGRPVALTVKEFALLELLLRHPGQVVDRGAITAHIWDDNHDPFANVLEVLVRRLRSKIDDGFEPKLIHTVRGAGYRLGLST